MDLNSCLDILEIPRNSSPATFEQAKAAYRLIVQVWHPDKYSHNQKLHEMATEKLKLINAAWDVVEKHFNSGNDMAVKRVTEEELEWRLHIRKTIFRQIYANAGYF